LTTAWIGITTSRNDSQAGYPVFTLAEAYVNAILGAGAIPVMIPLGLPEEGLSKLLSRVDGVLFSGGGDVHPERYGSVPHPRVGFVDEDRDRVEALLVNHTLQQGLPIFGICRGLQLINVALGGTLYEDLGDQLPGAIQHNHAKGHPRDYLAHTVQVKEGSLLAGALGSQSTQVNSLHHQGIRQLAASLQASAFAPDGVVEGVELPGYSFGLAVQWHPEWLQAHPAMRRLFQAFVAAAAAQS
jgi:putative glutamine amidotransferase